MDAQNQSLCVVVQTVHYTDAADMGRHCTVVQLCTCLRLSAEVGKESLPEGSQHNSEQLL